MKTSMPQAQTHLANLQNANQKLDALLQENDTKDFTRLTAREENK